MVDEHYFLGDIITIAAYVTHSYSNKNKPLSDAQTAFLAFAHNLYHQETVKIPYLLDSIS